MHNCNEGDSHDKQIRVEIDDSNDAAPNNKNNNNERDNDAKCKQTFSNTILSPHFQLFICIWKILRAIFFSLDDFITKSKDAENVNAADEQPSGSERK